MKQRILSMLLVLCLLAALLPQVVPTASAAIRYGECGDYDSDVRWLLDTETGVLTISGTGAMDSPSWSAYEDSIVTVIVEEGVTSVSWYAFYECPNLTSVTLAESVAKVEEYAFVNCVKLESVTFLNPTCLLGEPSFGNYEVSGREPTFYGYKGSPAEGYAKMYSFDFVALPDNPAYTDLTWEFDETAGVLSISGTGAMRDYYGQYDSAPWSKHRSAIQKVVVGEGVTYIGENAFYECTALTEVSFPSTLTSIGDYAFYGCTVLTEITLPESVETFDRYAFQNCTALESVTFLNPQTYCPNVYTPYLGVAGQTVIRGHIPSDAQSYTQFGYTFEPICEHIYDETVCTLCGADRVLKNHLCEGEIWTLDLETGHLLLSPTEESVNEDEYTYFGYCATEIRSLEVQDGVTDLGAYAFYGYDSLVSIHLAQSVRSIDEGAFYSCSNLKSATILNPNVNFAGPYRLPFSGCAEGFVFHAHENSSTHLFAEDYGFGFEALPDSLPTGQVTWSLDEESGVLTISGNGRMLDYRDCEDLPWFDLLEQIKAVVIEDGITHIGSSAFSVCTAMTSVSIPDSVTSIGHSAFAYCDLLQSVVLPDGLTKIPASLFMYCASLTSVNIPEGVTSIGAYAFKDCPLQSIDIPDSVETIYWGVFSGCKELTEVVLPDGLTVLEEGIFYGCSSLQKVTIPDSVTEIKESAFSSCTALESITIPEGVTELDYSVFSDCSSLQSVSIPEGVTELDYGVFSDCDSLADITIPDSVRSIGERAFYGCDKLESISIPNSVTEIGENAFFGCPLTTVTIPESVTYVGSNAFFNCTALESVYVLNPECFVSTDAKTLGSSEQTVIYAQGGSLAESYADMNGYRFYHICTCGGYDCVFEETEIAPTCGKNGSTKMICVDCGYSYPVSQIPATGEHSYELTSATAAGCGSNGKNVYTCSVCGDTKIETVPSTGEHSYELTSVTEAFCGNDGKNVYTCSVCGITKIELVPTTGEHSYEVISSTPPSCESYGIDEYICSVCGTLETVWVSPRGHQYDEGVVIEEVSCYSDGLVVYTCTVCGASKERSIPCTGHTGYDEGVVTVETTCTTDGIRLYTCADCGATKEEIIPSRGHAYFMFHSNGWYDHTCLCLHCDYEKIEEHRYNSYECVICLHSKPKYVDGLQFSHSLTLENDISINFIGKGEQLREYDIIRLECTVPVYEGNEKVGTKIVELKPVYDGTNYVFTLTDITAKMMNDEIEAVFHLEKYDYDYDYWKHYYSKTDVYSIAEYAYGMLDREDASDALKTVCANLLRYGAAAQEHFDYRTDALANAAMTEEHRAYLSDLSTLEMDSFMKLNEDHDAPKVAWKSATLELGNKVIMCLIVNLSGYTGKVEDLTMRLSYTKSNGELVTEDCPLTLYNAEKCYYAVSYEVLRATEMRSVVTAAIYEGETRVSKTVNYSIESYGARVENAQIKDLCRAMLAYGDSAYDFFAN